jgi:hypothetical protein
MGKPILRYLARTTDYRLDVLKVDTDTIMRFEDYTDADWVSDSADRKSVNTALMYLNDMLVSWDWKMQALVSLSTMESEFVSAARGVQGAMGCYNLVKESEISIQLPIQLRMQLLIVS